MAHFQLPEALEEAVASLCAPVRLTAPCDLPADRPFHAEVTDASVGPVVVARIVSTPAYLARQPRMIGSTDRELVKLTLHRGGHLIVAQDGRQSRARPGELFAYETIRPYELVGRDRCDIVIVGVPRSMLGSSGDLISRRTAVTLPCDNGIRSVIAAFFTGLADTMLAGRADGPGGPGGPGALYLADTVASLLMTAFADTPAERAELSTDLPDRILAYALANLHDPGLSVGSVASRFGVSPRYLYRLMRDRNIRFGAWVRQERMKRIRRDLLDPRLANSTAAAIAARWGIHNPVHLSRSLRAEFGCSAAEIRALAVDRASLGKLVTALSEAGVGPDGKVRVMGVPGGHAPYRTLHHHRLLISAETLCTRRALILHTNVRDSRVAPGIARDRANVPAATPADPPDTLSGAADTPWRRLLYPWRGGRHRVTPRRRRG